MTFPAPIVRPNGKLYRPLQVLGHGVLDDNEELTAILVTGTHDIGRAQKLANQCVAWWIDPGYVAVKPEAGWWRDGFACGRRSWIYDDVRGRAGVTFREIVEGAP